MATKDDLRWEGQIPQAERIDFRDSDGVKLGEIHYTEFMDFVRYDPGMLVLTWMPDKGGEAWEAYKTWKESQ